MLRSHTCLLSAIIWKCAIFCTENTSYQIKSRTTWDAAHPVLGSCLPQAKPLGSRHMELEASSKTIPSLTYPRPHRMSTTTKHSDTLPCVRQHLLYWKQSMKPQVLCLACSGHSLTTRVRAGLCVPSCTHTPIPPQTAGSIAPRHTNST